MSTYPYFLVSLPLFCVHTQAAGKHTVHVCLGTACHVRGGARILKGLSHKLGIKPGDTTEDKNYTLETVRCIGCCSLAPVVKVDNDAYGYNTVDKIQGS